MQNAIQNQRFNQPGPGFQTPQMQRSPMPLQQQTQTPQPQQQQQQHAGQGMMGVQMPRNQGQAQMGLGGQPGMNQQGLQGPQGLSQQEAAIVNRLAQQMYQTASPQEREIARQRILSGSQQQVQALQQRQIDPAQWYFRQAAARTYAMQKKSQQSQNGQQQQQLQQGNFAGGLGGMPGQQNPVQSIVNGPQSQIGTNQQSFGNNFGGDVRQIMGLQESAIREQEAGRMVVPATPQQQQQQQRMAGQQGFNQQPNQMGAQAVQQQMINQQNMLQSGRINPAQAQGRPNTITQASRQQGLHGQAGSLGGPMSQGLTHQSPAMPTLNRPMDMNTSRTPSQAQQKQPPQRADPSPAPTQAGRGVPLQNKQSQQNMQQSQQQQQHTPSTLKQQLQGRQSQSSESNGLPGFNWKQWPPEVQDALRKMSDDQRKTFLKEKMQQVLEKRMNGGGQAPQSQLQPGKSQPGQSQQTQAKQQPAAPAGGHSTPAPGAASALKRSDSSTGPSASFNSIPKLSKEELEKVDDIPYPPGILSSDIALQHIPADVKTWRELKAWCRSHQHIVAPESIRKLDGLQTMHVAARLKQQLANEAQAQRQGQNVNGQPVPHASNQPGPAPMAPMVQPRPNQARNLGHSNLSGHPIFQVKPEEIQACRARLPPTAPNMTDDQIKTMIIRRRMLTMNQQAINMKKQPPFPHLTQGGNQNQQGQLQQSQAQNQQISQDTLAANKQDKTSAQAVASKAVKGSSNAGPQPRSSSAASPQQQPQLPAAANKQAAQMQKVASNQGPKPVQQQSTSQPSQQPQQPQQGAQQQKSGAAEIDEKTMARFREIKDEVSRDFKPRPPVPMDNETRNRMIASLKENVPFLHRSEIGAAHYFALVDGDEDHLRDILTLRLALLSQLSSDTPGSAPQFTMTFNEAFMGAMRIRQLFLKVTAKKREDIAPTSKPTQPTVNPLQPQTSQQEPVAQPMVKQQSKQKHPREKEPPAPTTDKPPFAFGSSPPPHGVPTYGQNVPKVTQENLSIPPPKRRKTDSHQIKDQLQAAGPSAPAAPTPPTAARRQAPALHKPEPAFKCAVLGCEHAKKGFTTEDSLAQHVEDVHKEKDPEDALAFALEQARVALGLDANGKATAKERPVKMEKSLSAQPMRLSASAQGPTPKMEGGTPMSRGTTHMSNLGGPRTPQPSGKTLDPKATPRSNQGKATPSKEPITPDAWSDLGMTPQDLAAHFPSMGDIQGSLSVSSLTPASTLGSKSEKDTPKSDIGEDASIKINIDADPWLPSGFLMDCYDRDIDSSFVNDDILGMDWETAFPKSDEPRQRVKKRGPDPNFRSDLFGLRFGAGDDGTSEDWLL